MEGNNISFFISDIRNKIFICIHSEKTEYYNTEKKKLEIILT